MRDTGSSQDKKAERQMGLEEMGKRNLHVSALKTEL